MSILCVETLIKIEELKKRAKNQFKDRLVKAVVDIERAARRNLGPLGPSQASYLPRMRR